jgi:methyl-accepting chemotaxis protein
MFSLKNVKVRSKLALLIGVAALGIIFLGALSLVTLNTVKVGGDIYHSINLDDQVNADITPPALFLLQAALTANAMDDAANRAELDSKIQEITECDKRFEEAAKTYAAQLPEGKIRQFLQTRIHPTGREYLDAVEKEYIPMLQSGDLKKAGEFRRTVLTEKFKAHEAADRQFDDYLDEDNRHEEAGAEATVRSRTIQLVALGSASLLFLIFFGWFMARGIAVPLKQTVNVLQSVAEGDLSTRLELDSTDEIGEMVTALNHAIEKIGVALNATAEGAGRVASASGEISASATQQAAGAESQKNQINQVATAMHEMSTTVTLISENSTKAAEAARRASETARHGGTIVEETLAKMREIANSVGDSAQKVKILGGRSDQIGQIIAVIDDIADQTNLLALNAAIEAARAGEQGRGFAVVADEVRKLAERTGKATKEIAAMIKSIQEETKTAVSAMETGTKQVDDGVKTTTQAGASLQQIIQSAEQLGDMVTQIATAATEQSSATEEVNANVEQILKITAEAADGAQQSAQACSDLSSLAVDLQNIVSQFKLENNGHEPARRATPRAKLIPTASRTLQLKHGTRKRIEEFSIDTQ